MVSASAVITLLTALIGLVVLFVKYRQASKPKREDKSIDEIFAKKDNNSELGALQHELDDRMREQDPNLK